MLFNRTFCGQLLVTASTGMIVMKIFENFVDLSYGRLNGKIGINSTMFVFTIEVCLHVPSNTRFVD